MGGRRVRVTGAVGCLPGRGPAGVAAGTIALAFPFKRLAAEAQDALRAEDAEPAASALEQLIDLAREADGYDYFRSDDPVAAAGFVVSDVAAAGHPHFREFAAEIGAAIPP
ncbi:Uncharacterised protein [Mycobacterium tuberculosis]|nr:Uncharacterised protein [Mycobacterium tuberculosis]